MKNIKSIIDETFLAMYEDYHYTRMRIQQFAHCGINVEVVNQSPFTTLSIHYLSKGNGGTDIKYKSKEESIEYTIKEAG